MSSPEEEFLQALRATFRAEADEHLQAIAAGLLAMERVLAPQERRDWVERVFRAAHSLKGAARAVNLADVESACQSMEDIFAGWKQKGDVPEPQELDALHRTLDVVLRAVAPPRPVLEAPAPAAAGPVAQPVAGPEDLRGGGPGAGEGAPGAETVRIAVSKLDAQLFEAEEMLAAKLITRQRAAELHELRDCLSDWKKAWAREQPRMRALRQALDRPAADLPTAPGRDVAGLLELVAGCHDRIEALEAKIAALSRKTEQDRLAMGKLVDDLLENSKKLRMLPLGTLGGLFPKLVRDLCRDQGKEADLVVRGEDVEMDKRILEEMKDPLIHLLRNCVDHGIERPEERRRLGKPARATITLAVSRLDGNKVELLVSDDGAGIDAAKVKEAALRHGILTPEDARRLGESDVHSLIFETHLSTRPEITEVSGRGLGLAIVRERAGKLGGLVSVESRRHQGTTIRMTLPVALATFRGILVEAAGRPFAVPTAQVERVVRVEPETIRTVEGRPTISFGGRAVALARLEDVLELPPAPASGPCPAAVPVMILSVGDQRVGFAVDAVLDEQEILVRPLGKPLSRVRNIAGATVLGSGQVAPILRVSDLLKSAKAADAAPRAAAEPAMAAASARTAPSVLVVEDSITSRMLLKSILEAAGYRVKTAVDGLDAFTALRTEPVDLVVSDVEMPRMSGFDLTARIRADRKLAELPVVLVTARETREDRERGIDAGANAYLVKSSFDQSDLLETVRRLV